MEGRIPPFISPIYSPCQTMETKGAAVTQTAACRRTGRDTSCWEDETVECALVRGTDGNNGFFLIRIFTQPVTQLHKLRCWICVAVLMVKILRIKS